MTTSGGVTQADTENTAVEGGPTPRWVWAIAAAMAVALAVLGLLRHRFYLSNGLDMGFYLQGEWSITHGVWFQTFQDMHVLSDHLSPIALPLSLLTLVPLTAEIWIVLQAVVVASGVVPAFRLGRGIAQRRGGVLAAAWYSMSATLWYGTLYDVHPVMLGIAPLMWLVQRAELRPTPIALALGELTLLMMREDLAVLGAIVVLIAYVRTRDKWLAVTAAVALAIVGLYVQFGHTFFGDGTKYVEAVRYRSFGSSVPSIIIGIPLHLGTFLERVTSPAALGVFIGVMAPMLFLSVIGWRVAWPGLALLTFNVISDHLPIVTIVNQYQTPAVPFIIWGALIGYRKLVVKSAARAAPLYRTSLVVTVVLFVVIGPLLSVSNPEADRKAWVILTSADRTGFDEVIAHVPPDASVAASGKLAPRLAFRREVHALPLPLVCPGDPAFQMRHTSYPDYLAVSFLDGEMTPEETARSLPPLGYTRTFRNDLGEVWQRTGQSPPTKDCGVG